MNNQNEILRVAENIHSILDKRSKCNNCAVELHEATSGRRHAEDGYYCEKCFMNKVDEIFSECPTAMPL